MERNACWKNIFPCNAVRSRNYAGVVGDGARLRAGRNLRGPELRWSCCGLLALRLAARQFLDFLFVGAARGSALGFGSGLFAGGAFYFLAFYLVFNLGGVCQLKPLSI